MPAKEGAYTQIVNGAADRRAKCLVRVVAKACASLFDSLRIEGRSFRISRTRRVLRHPVLRFRHAAPRVSRQQPRSLQAGPALFLPCLRARDAGRGAARRRSASALWRFRRLPYALPWMGQVLPGLMIFLQCAPAARRPAAGARGGGRARAAVAARGSGAAAAAGARAAGSARRPPFRHPPDLVSAPHLCLRSDEWNMHVSARSAGGNGKIGSVRGGRARRETREGGARRGGRRVRRNLSPLSRSHLSPEPMIVPHCILKRGRGRGKAKSVRGGECVCV
jgi:hypothetical protein